MKIIITCEHAVNAIPKAYGSLFLTHFDLLNSHRGIDFGALEIAQQLHQMTQAPLIQAVASRLLIDCNRSLNHRGCFSEITLPLLQTQKESIIKEFYQPYRDSVVEQIHQFIEKGHQVLHLSIHSFTPILNGKVRNVDVGLLYDPQRLDEKKFAHLWKRKLHHLDPGMVIRMNAPYQGTSDGLTTALRKYFPQTHYIGIELETNQKLVENTQSLTKLKNIIADSLLLTTSLMWS